MFNPDKQYEAGDAVEVNEVTFVAVEDLNCNHCSLRPMELHELCARANCDNVIWLDPHDYVVYRLTR